MKKLILSSLLLVAAALTLSSCNCFKKMAKHADEVSLTCKPEVLTLSHGIVAADITATFPAKYFAPKAIVKITPVIVFEGGEVAGTPKFFQGEKVEGNYTVIRKADGGTYTQHVEFPFDERMRISELHLRLEAKCKPDAEFVLYNVNTHEAVTEKVLAKNPNAVRESGMKVAEGVNTLQEDLRYADAMTALPSNFKRVTTTVNKTDIRYAINSANVSKGALKEANLDAFKADVNAKKQNARATQNIAVKGYASPDGPEKFNDRLSRQRSESGDKVIAKLLKDSGLEVDMAAYGEDWEGFKELVAASNIQDKEMILQVLGMYESSTQREAEIKNISSVFGQLKKDILPQLRRSAVVNSTDIEGRSDAEMLELIASGRVKELSLNELLHIGEVSNNAAVRMNALKAATTQYSDSRAWNNLAIEQMRAGDEASSLASLKRAAQMGETSAALTSNLAVASAANGDMDAARQYAKGADAKAQALVEATDGNYTAAARQLEGMNAAVAHTMNKDYASAKRAIASDASADADYMRAVIASQQGDAKAAEAELRAAVAKKPELASKARKDVHFAQLFKGGMTL